MCAPMSPSAPLPASSARSRQTSGNSGSTIQSCRYCARTWRTVPIRPAATSAPGERDRRHPPVVEPDHRAHPERPRLARPRPPSTAPRPPCWPAASRTARACRRPARRWRSRRGSSPGVQMSTSATSSRCSSGLPVGLHRRPAEPVRRGCDRHGVASTEDGHPWVQREVEDPAGGAPGPGVGDAHEGVADHADPEPRHWIHGSVRCGHRQHGPGYWSSGSALARTSA